MKLEDNSSDQNKLMMTYYCPIYEEYAKYLLWNNETVQFFVGFLVDYILE